MSTIAVYPGRFQPFGKHHYETYKWVVEKFGKDNVYISTSNSTGKENPLTFEEKKRVMVKFGVPKEKVCESDRPYMPVNLLNNFDKRSDSLIVVYGEKDYGRLQFKRKDGNPSYFKNYTGELELNPFSDSAYVLVAPHVRLDHKGSEICGTYLRELLSTCTRKEMFEVMGWLDEGLYGVFRRKFQPSYKPHPVENISERFDPHPISEFKLALDSNTSNTGKYSRHICHPHECEMTFRDLKRFVNDVTKNVQAIDKCTLKLDGWNLQMTYKNGQFACSRNKSTVVDPMSLSQLSAKYAGKPDVQFVFCSAFKSVEAALGDTDQRTLDAIFASGKRFLNFEVIHPKTGSVFKTNPPAISFHGMISYDDNGNELSRSNTLPESIEKWAGRVFNGFTMTTTPRIELKQIECSDLLQNRLTLLQHKFKIPESTNIMHLPKPALSELRLFCLDLGNLVIKSRFPSGDAGIFNGIIKTIEGIGDSLTSQSDIEIFDSAIYCLDRLGGYRSLNPVEGFVVEWEGRQLKLTGSFAVLVPIFRLRSRL